MPMPLMLKVRPTFVTFFIGLIALPGLLTAQEVSLYNSVIRSNDLRRLQELDHHAGRALRKAFASGQENDLAALVDALAGSPMPAKEAKKAIVGTWSCRMIKLGKISPLTVYPDFACEVTQDGRFEKTTGSQRTKGDLYLGQDQLIYLGTGFVEGETPRPYADLPTEISPQDSPQLMPEIGVVEMTGKDKGRILFPAPYLESQMNVLVLTR